MVPVAKGYWHAYTPLAYANWEQGRRKPEGSARIPLRIVAEHPEAVLDVVSRSGSRRRA